MRNQILSNFYSCHLKKQERRLGTGDYTSLFEIFNIFAVNKKNKNYET